MIAGLLWMHLKLASCGLPSWQRPQLEQEQWLGFFQLQMKGSTPWREKKKNNTSRHQLVEMVPEFIITERKAKRFLFFFFNCFHWQLSMDDSGWSRFGDWNPGRCESVCVCVCVNTCACKNPHGINTEEGGRKLVVCECKCGNGLQWERQICECVLAGSWGQWPSSLCEREEWRAGIAQQRKTIFIVCAHTNQWRWKIVDERAGRNSNMGQRKPGAVREIAGDRPGASAPRARAPSAPSWPSRNSFRELWFSPGPALGPAGR